MADTMQAGDLTPDDEGRLFCVAVSHSEAGRVLTYRGRVHRSAEFAGPGLLVWVRLDDPVRRV